MPYVTQRVTFECGHMDLFIHSPEIGDMIYCGECGQQRKVIALRIVENDPQDRR